jgi:hypothetical protein
VKRAALLPALCAALLGNAAWTMEMQKGWAATQPPLLPLKTL